MKNQAKINKNQNEKEVNTFICQATGEIVDNKEKAIEAIENMNKQNEKNNAVKQALKREYGLLPEKVLIYQRGVYYMKLYKPSFEILLEMSVNARALFTTLVCLTDKDDNSILYKNKYISNTDLIEISKMSRNVLRIAMDELEYYGIIVTEGGTRNRKIYINPKVLEDTATDTNIHKKFDK